jgi:hypothetical protein
MAKQATLLQQAGVEVAQDAGCPPGQPPSVPGDSPGAGQTSSLGTGEAPALPPSAKPERFDWNNDDAVVFPTHQGIAVYTNGEDDVVIRQQSEAFCEEDAFVIIPRDKARAVADAIYAALDE